MSLRFFLFFILFSFFACTNQQGIYKAYDYAYVGDYTLGLEGPAVDFSGNLYFVNPLKKGTIGTLNTANEFSLFLDTLPNGSVANGIRFDSNESMYLADYTNHQVLRVDIATKAIETFAYDSLINQPNDLAISKNNVLFASDPNWANSTGNLLKVVDHKFFIVEANMGTTNGIEISPDEKRLYVNESIQRTIWVYDLDSELTISKKRVFYKFDDFGLDGMRSDSEGNLYVTRHGKGTVVVINPQGELIQEVQLKGKKPSNIAFGGKDGKTAFVTLQDRGYIESFRTEFPGRAHVMKLQNKKFN